ncbi:unnamed protein product, partial [marine sediment metagenome]
GLCHRVEFHNLYFGRGQLNVMTRIGFKIDEIFEILEDLKWHDVDEVSRGVSLSKPMVRAALKLMAVISHVEYRQGRVRIDREMLEWLRATKARPFGSSPAT